MQRLRLLLVVLALPCLVGSVSAQWLEHRTANVPRLADGKPNLAAPAPRAVDGKPDLSGIWYLHFDGCGRFGCADYQAGPEFFDYGAKLPGGLPYLPWAATLVKERMSQFAKDDPIGLCRPGGLFRFHTFPPPRKMLQLSNLVVILSERDVTYRQIFVDGRSLPTDPEPTWNGYSVGRWEGETLVVQTNGLREGTWIDRNGSPLTAAAQVTERFRRVSFGRLDIEVTVNDPKAYSRPWTVTLNQDLAADTELLDYHCTDNEKAGLASK
jgi:hypothetical protein